MNKTFTLRPAQHSDLPALSHLCLRSKAYWGYDAAFMAACVPVLTLTADDLNDPLIVAWAGDRMAGMAQVSGAPGDMDIDRLFVDPTFIGTGCGRVLFNWCMATAKARDETRSEKHRVGKKNKKT